MPDANAWLAIVGTLSGTAMGSATAWLVERGKWKRQRVERWDEARRVLYAQHLSNVDRLREKLQKLAQASSSLSQLSDRIHGQAVGDSVVSTDTILDIDSSLAPIAASMETSVPVIVAELYILREKTTEIDLVASEAVASAVARLIEALTELFQASSEVPMTKDAWQVANDRFKEARNQVVTSRRKELAV
ncbi:MAG: hypothetical protein M3256_28090 [Actinomycetota bacterium]|nr:hypothetical protein [Actinomycetota bacterium]